jgi:hypothetical protein
MPKINEPRRTTVGSEIQSVLFDNKKYTVDEAKKWLSDNDFSGMSVDEEAEGNNFRFRQHNPERYKTFKTIESGKDGIKFIIGFKDKGRNKVKSEKQDEGMEENTSLDNINFDAIKTYCDKLGIAEDVRETIFYLIENFYPNEWIQFAQILNKLYWDLDYKKMMEVCEIKFTKSDMQKTMQNKGVRLFKESMDSEKRLVYGIVIEPKSIDTDNEWVDEKDIENACHTFMKYFQEVGVDHTTVVIKGLKIVENYIALSNININGVTVKKGSWVMVHYVEDDKIWDRVKEGNLTGYSFEGIGILANEKPKNN